MLNYKEVRKIVENDLEKNYDEDIKIYDEASLELESGWVFFYDLANKNKKNYLVGNAPYIVNKFTGKIYLTGTAEPLEYFIDSYEEEINGHKNIWTIRLERKIGLSKIYKAFRLNKTTNFYFKEIWEMLNSYPNIFKEGDIRKIFPIKVQFENMGIQTIMNKK